MTFLRSANRNCRSPSLPQRDSMNSNAGVAEVVGQPAVHERCALEVAHRRDDVGDRGVADRHQVERLPVARHVIGQPLVDPQRQAAAEQRSRDDVELEDVRQLVRDQAVERVGRLVDRQHHAIAIRLGEREHAFGQLARLDVLLLELALRLVEDERDLEGQVVLQVGADLLIRALRVAGDPLEVLLDLRVVVDLEMVRGVDVPLEIVVPDPVLAEVRHVRRLGDGLLDGSPATKTSARRARWPSARRGRACCACACFTSEAAAEAGSPAARTRRRQIGRLPSPMLL